MKHCNRMDVTKNRSQYQIKNEDILLTYIGLLTMRKSAYESVHEFDDDQEWLSMAEACSRDVQRPRDGKTVYIGSDWKPVTYKTDNGEEKNITIRAGYEIINRTIDKHSQFLFPNDIEANT